mmetsp:Transcript_12004/g.28553  ORF Transcript_12004/g.28553 Transcript_12004/m.28553 type:complete len:362 (+) Transcript_12004:115-1200(+)
MLRAMIFAYAIRGLMARSPSAAGVAEAGSCLCNRGEKPEVCLERCRRPVAHEKAAEPATISPQPFFCFPSPTTWTGVLVYSVASLGVMLVSFLIEAWTVGDGSFRVLVRAEHRPAVSVGPVHGHLQVCDPGVAQKIRPRRAVPGAPLAQHRSRMRLRPPPPPPDDGSERHTYPPRFPGVLQAGSLRPPPPDLREPWSARYAGPPRGWNDAPSHSRSASSARASAPRHGAGSHDGSVWWGRDESEWETSDSRAEKRPRGGCHPTADFPALEFSRSSPRRTESPGAAVTHHAPLLSPTQSRTAAYRALRRDLVSDMVFSPRRLVGASEQVRDTATGFCLDQVDGMTDGSAGLRYQDYLPRFGS